MSKERLEEIHKFYKERLSELLPHTAYYIEKLKEEIKNLERRLEEQIESNRMYMWKNKRYQEALKNIVNSDGWLIEPNPFCTIEEAYERCVDEAQKALEGEKHD